MPHAVGKTIFQYTARSMYLFKYKHNLYNVELLRGSLPKSSPLDFATKKYLFCRLNPHLKVRRI